MEITRMNEDISKFFWTVPNHFQFCSWCTNILYDAQICQIHLLCYLLKVSKVLNYCGWFCKFFRYWWEALLVSFRYWLLSSFRQPSWQGKLMWSDCREKATASNLINKVLRPVEGQCLTGVHKLQRYVHTWQIRYNLVVFYCVSIGSICLL